MKSPYPFVAAGFLILLAPLAASAAPLPGIGPVDLEATVVEAHWSAEVKVKGMPGLSGTLGIDRTFPARYHLVVKDFKGVTPAQAWAMVEAFGGRLPEKGRDQMPATIVVQLDSKDSKAIQPGMRIRLTGYEVMGDEGGTWTTVKKLEAFEAKSK